MEKLKISLLKVSKLKSIFFLFFTREEKLEREREERKERRMIVRTVVSLDRTLFPRTPKKVNLF